MVYIKRLRIQGFKSFSSKRSSIELEKGFVVVTGPNGGGKSNVLDAIRFALGELSAHNLRVGRMAELVHDDPSTNWARVSLTFDNSDRILPVDSDEVTISRKISKSGESEYYVNGRQVSRNELLLMLSMANIKSSGFNIVPQGSVVEIAEMGGADLRRMLEEVAGISDYEKKKAEAEEQLAIAEKNLAVAKASAKEVKARVKQLEKERNQMFRRRQVEDFLNAIKLLKIRKSISGLESELEEVDKQLLDLERKLEELESTRANLLEKKKKLDEQIDFDAAESRRIEEELRSLQSEKGDVESRLNNLRISLSVMKERSERMLKEQDYLSERLDAINDRLSELKIEEIETREELESLSRKLEEARRKADDVLRALGDVEKSYQALKREIEEDKRKRDEERLSIEAALTRAKARRSELQRRAEEISKKLEKLSEHRVSAYIEFRDLKKEVEKIEAEENAIKEKISSLEQAVNELSAKLLAMEELEQKLSNVLERIAATGILEERNEEEEVIEAIRSAGIPGVKGVLKDALIMDESALKLLGPVIGDWLKAVVVDDWAIGEKLAKLFSRFGKNLRIIALDVAAAYDSEINLLGLSFKKKWAELALRYLLKDTDFSGRKDLLGAKKIISDGVIIYPDLRIETLSPDKSELAELVTREYQSAATILRELRHKLRKLRETARAITIELDENKKALVNKNLEKNRLFQRILSLQADIAQSTISEIEGLLELQKLSNEQASLDREIEQQKKLLEKFSEAYMDPRESELKALGEKLSTEQKRYNESKLECAKIELEIRNLEKKLDELGGEDSRLSTEKTEIEKKMQNIEKEREDLLRKIEETSEEIVRFEENLSRIVQKMEDLNDLRSELREKLDENSKLARDLTAELENLENEIQKLSSSKSSLQVRRAQLEVQLNNLREKMAEIGSSSIELPGIRGDLFEKLERELEEEMKELEMVNQLAPSQYEEIVGNYKLRSSRIAELEAERQEILKFIEWVEGEKKRIFMETFNRVADAFEDYFTKLTGGRGWLRLENPDNPFDGGVEMILAFPGKQPRSSRAASGGEKSVAAVALLLALQGLTPADFYIFDEVDAHMDLQYTKKLADLLKEMARRTQIIIISLKDVVVEKADQVVGVYNSGGVSRIVKAKLEEVARSG